MKITRRHVHLAVTLLTLLAAAIYSRFQNVPTDASSQSKNALSGASATSLAATSANAHVIKVVDGDTVDVEANGARLKLRIIGINTPETVDPRRPVQCFGREASARAHQMLDNANVTIAADASQDDVDKYGRSLRFITLPDGSDYGRAMIADGYAHEYTYDVPYAKQAEYRAAEKEASTAKRGLWAADTCAGNTTKAAAK
jgi:micrococcal nuclease